MSLTSLCAFFFMARSNLLTSFAAASSRLKFEESIMRVMKEQRTSNTCVRHEQKAG